MRFFIKNYIDRLSKEDISRFGLDNGIDLTIDELDFIYGTLKDRWEEIIYGDFSSILDSASGRIDEGKIKKIESLFYLYKEKYKDYL